MMNSNMFGLMAVENTTSEVEIDNEFNLEDTEFEMAIELAAEAADIESEDLKTTKYTQAEKNENSAKERLANILNIIEERRNGKMPEFYKENSEEAEELKMADKNAVMTELKVAQDELDKASTEAYAAKLSLISNDNKQEYSVPVKFEHTCEIDDENIIKRNRNEYVYMFKANMRRTALATLDMCRVVYEAEKSLTDAEFHEFCRQINYKSDSSTIRKFSTIGKVYPRFIQYAEQLPAAWTSIYGLTQIPAEDFERCVKDGFALNNLTGSEIAELVKKTREINNSVSPFKQDKKSLQFAVATVFFTKKVDDTDFRLLQKAFDEIASRIPVKLVVKKDAIEYFQKRRALRYEKLKIESDDVMVKPEKWDYGIAANQVNNANKPELKLAA